MRLSCHFGRIGASEGGEDGSFDLEKVPYLRSQDPTEVRLCHIDKKILFFPILERNCPNFPSQAESRRLFSPDNDLSKVSTGAPNGAVANQTIWQVAQKYHSGLKSRFGKFQCIAIKEE